MRERDIVALTALLDGIGRFWQHTGEAIQECNWGAEFCARHVKLAGVTALIDSESYQSIVQKAASYLKSTTSSDKPGRLEAVTEYVSLASSQRPSAKYFYPLKPLSITSEVFPVAEADAEQDEYESLWTKFVSEHSRLPVGSFKAYFESLVHLLHKYTWCVPADDPGVSLYDHIRVTCALSICLFELEKIGRLDDGEFLIIEGDLSGIQNFIYNPAFNGQEVHDGVARRLRGRSFYLNLLAKTLSDYLVEALNLEIVNVIWATGGHFLVLAPDTDTVRERLTESKRTIQHWIWKEFRGALGVILGQLSITRESFADFGSVKAELSHKLSELKLRQFESLLDFDASVDRAWEDSFTLRMGNGVCVDTGRDLNDYEISISSAYNDDARLRSLQSLHFDRIGRVLVSASTLQMRRKSEWAVDKERVAAIPEDEHEAHRFKNNTRKVLVEFPELGRCWLISDSTKAMDGADLCLRLAHSENQQLEFLPEFNRPDTVSYGFELFAGEVKADSSGYIAEFHELAEAARGSKHLAVLRMDVDNLGLVFSRGLSKRSIPRVANLSRMLDWFFSGYLNSLVAGRNLYTTYAGGDDLFIVGAWNEVLELSRNIRADFKRFCAANPDLHISGGISLCKGKYPIARAAEEAGEALDEIAKGKARFKEDSDKDSLAFLEQKVNWEHLEQLIRLGDQMIKAIAEEKLSRKFVYQILSLYRYHIDPNRRKPKQELQEVNKEDFVWLPRFLYILARNVKDIELRLELQKQICAHKRYIPVLAGYVSLTTRKS